MAVEGYSSPSGFLSFTKTWHNKPYHLISPDRPELSATGKNVVITGGGSGIGKAAAIAFAQAGAKSVAILGRSAERLKAAAVEIAAAGPTAQVISEPADMTLRAAVDAAFKKITDKVGKIDILVASAGAMPNMAPVLGYKEEDFRRGLEVNVIAAFNTIQAFLPLAAPEAKLFNVSSGIGHINPIPNYFTYSVTKAAAIKMFDFVATEHPEIHVVNIQPGVVLSDINRISGMPPQDEPELPGHFAVWLASPEAAFLKGKYVWVNWDVEELIARADEIVNSLVLRVRLAGISI